MRLDVLLTDGINKHTYAILRTLVKKNLKVGVVFNTKFSLSYFSKYPIKRFNVNKHIMDSENLYITELLNILQNNSINVLLPIGNISYKFITKHQKDIKKLTKVLVPDERTMQIAQNKKMTFEFAKQNRFMIPQTYFISKKNDINQIINEIKFPCVIKKINYYESGVIYCNNKKELETNYYNYIKKFGDNINFPIIQEYIQGKGVGFYALFDNGVCVANFTHERIHEFPITGGASTLAKSTKNKKLEQVGMNILEKLEWNGVAMVEFKKDKNDNYYLIEINPKFWGSLELSFVAGINFPYLVYQLLNNKELTEQKYKENIYFRWVIPHDFLWYCLASKTSKKEFKKLKDEQKILNNLHFEDPLTIIYNLLFTVYKLFKEKKYPHGSINK